MFAHHHMLKLVGMTSFTGKLDAYMAKKMVEEMKMPEGRLCGYVNPDVKVDDKYEPQCPVQNLTGEAATIQISVICVLLCVLGKLTLA